MIAVAPLTTREEDAYRDFVLRQEHGLVYATLEYRDFLRAAVGGEPLYLVAREGEKIVGVLPSFRLNHPRYGTVVNSLPWYGSHGGCLVPGGAHEAETRAALLREYRRAAASALAATLIVSPFEQREFETYREALQPAAIDRRTGQLTRLPEAGPGLESRLEGILRQKTRNLARKSLRQGLLAAVEDDDDAWRFLHEVHVENIQAIGGRAKPWAHFEALKSALPRDWRRLYVARFEGAPVAALLVLDYSTTTEYFTPVVRNEFRSRQALSFLIWHAMLGSVEKSMKWWNWGGTWLTQRSLHHFKAGWGAADFPYSYLIQASPESVARIGAERASILEAFPYYYIYPNPPA